MFEEMMNPIDSHPIKAPASAAWDVLDTIENYILKYRLTEEEGRQLLQKLLAVETTIKAQSSPPPPDF